MKDTYNIAVLDDHALIPEAIKALLVAESRFTYVNGFRESAALFNYLEQGSIIDILLLDIQLTDEDGIKICEKLKTTFPKLISIMLSGNTQPASVMDALKKGAKGFLPKNIDHDVLIEAFEETLKGKTYLHQDISLVASTAKNSQYEYVPKLTRREKEVLQLIMDEITTAEISSKLLLSPSTVETHCASLFSKTGSKNVVGLIKFTLEKGLLD
jgi:DNA-binding NarL/FixJ family response regulator